MVFLADGACVYRSSTLIHEMVNVCDVAQWFRDATSDRRLEALCRLLDSCMPLELQFLNTYLDELLRRNSAVNQQTDSAMPELHEITDSTCRRQLCLILTRLKSASVLAGCIYNILIQYNFSEFFSRVMVMEEELVDEILLLFTLAANHPAMTFSQRCNLHQRLVDLRETIEKSFKCYHATDVCSQRNQEYICKPLEKSSTQEVTNLKGQQQMAETQNTELNMHPPENNDKTVVPANKTTFTVHIKDLRVVRVQQRTFDKKYEYIFEVTWSNGKVVRIHRAYGELFDFQCKLRRRYSKEISKMKERKVIPYLPARRPIKFCKGNQVLPDITQYVREFTRLPEKLLHSESVENFFSDGTEKNSDDKQQNSRTKQNSNHDKKDHASTDVSRVNVDVKSDKGAISIKSHSPKGKCSTSFSGKKFNSSLQTSEKLESKRCTALSPRINSHDPALSPKDRNKTNIHHQPRTILKSPNTCTQFLTTDKTINEKEAKTEPGPPTKNILCTKKLQPERTVAEEVDHIPNIIDFTSEDAITGESSSRTEINEAVKAELSISASSFVKEKTSLAQTSSLPSSEALVMVSPPTNSLIKVTSWTPQTTMPSSPNLSSTSLQIYLPASTSNLSSSSSVSVTTTSPRICSSEILFDDNLSPQTTILTATSFTSSTVTLSTVTSSVMMPSKSLALTSSTPTSSNVTPSTLNSLALIPFTSSLIDSSIPYITPSAPTITSTTLNMIASFSKPIMTSFPIPSILTVKPPHAPLTVAVPVHSPPPCVTCSSSNQSSSEGSVASPLSRTPLSSPAIPRTSEDTREDESTTFSYDQRMLNGSTCLSSRKCSSPQSKFCHCEKLEQDSNEDQAVEPCGEDIKTKPFTEKRKLKTFVNDLRSTSGKNGYTSHNAPQHGLLIVPNGYSHLHSQDPNLLTYNNYESPPTEQNNGDGFYEDDFTSHGAKTDDKNCNYIFQNGGHNLALDFNLNKSDERKYAEHPYLNQKSNGFSKPFCYNCGEYGHHGSQCSGKEIKESIVS